MRYLLTGHLYSRVRDKIVEVYALLLRWLLALVRTDRRCTDLLQLIVARLANDHHDFTPFRGKRGARSAFSGLCQRRSG